MRPTEILMDEHRVIETVLDCLEAMAARCAEGGSLDAQSAREAVDFFRGFADRCHHGKEEAELFPAMEARGFPADQGPTAVMRAEHAEGRRLLAEIERAIDGAAAPEPRASRAFAESSLRYTALLREHIQKEDHCLFPMADGALTNEDQAALLARFERVEQQDLGVAAHVRYLGLADALAARFGVRRQRATAEPCCGEHSS